MSACAAFLSEIQARSGGSISFERFMREALYHPRFGYYTAKIRTIGRRGDFSTWPVLDNLVGRAIAAWLARRPRTRHIIEVGAGQGQLARSVLKALGFLRRWRTNYHIVEVSPVLRELQQNLLGSHGAIWHDNISDALEAAGGEADIFSNELVDAFPCRVFRRAESGWEELHIRISDGRAGEVWRTTELPDSSAFDSSIPPGARVEVHASFHAWLDSWRPLWESGRMLTIDYGATMPDVYHRRPMGTLRAYAHHQRLTGAEVYGGFGTRDITADVNFSDLITWGEAARIRTVDLSTLGDFVEAHCGRGKLRQEFSDAAAAFQVLEQSAGA